MSLVKNKQTKIYTHEKKNFISSPFPESRLRLNRRIKACYCVFFNNCLHFYEMREYKKSVTILARLLCIVKCLFLAESFWYSLRIKTYFCPQLLLVAVAIIGVRQRPCLSARSPQNKATEAHALCLFVFLLRSGSCGFWKG